MKQLLLTIIFIAGLFDAVAHASELVRVSRVDKLDTVQLYFTFDQTPQFTTTSNERRVNLIFKDTTSAAGLSYFPADDKIVKILPHPATSEFALSLFFRYKPQQFKMTKSTDGKLVFEVLLGNEFSKSYENLAERLKGLTVLDRMPIDYSNPVLLSPYAKNWMSFFSAFETPVDIVLPVKFTTPPFPIIKLLPPKEEANLQVLDKEVFDLAAKGNWALVEEKLVPQIQATTDLEKQKLLALTLGETLMRKRDFQNAYVHLYMLKEQYHDELLGMYAEYLLILLRSIQETPFIADAEYQAMENLVGKTPLAPFFLISQIETALATGQDDRLNKLLLRDDVGLPKPLMQLFQIRQADYWYAIDQPLKAYAGYRLHKNSTVLASQPYSLGGYCSTLYDQKHYEEAGACYEKLAPLVSEKPLLGLVKYRENMAKLKYGEGTTLAGNFAQIEHTFAKTEAAYRSAMKKYDLMFLESREQSKQILEGYQEIANDSEARETRSEALFKKALVYAETDGPSDSIPLLQQLLREFQSGDVRISAQALLIQLLPGEIKRLVEKNDYIKALVLAKQNREFFQKNWIDSQFLVDTAEAYYRIGLYDEAQKLYLYLIETLPVDQREKFYLPMVQAAFLHGNYNIVEDFVGQYSYNYPSGEYAEAMLSFRLRALIGDERLTEALNLLPSPLPEDPELYEIAASIYFRLNDFAKCVSVLQKLSEKQNPLPQKEQFLLAESLFQTGDLAEAKKQFQRVTRDNEFYDESLFRLASLARKNGDEEKALSFLREIVEKGSNPRWKQFAEQELQFKSTTERR